MTEEIRLCHFLQFAGDFFFPLRGKTGLYRGVIFVKIIKMMRGRGYHAESGEKRGGGFLSLHFSRFPFLTGCGAGIFFERMRGENL